MHFFLTLMFVHATQTFFFTRSSYFKRIGSSHLLWVTLYNDYVSWHLLLKKWFKKCAKTTFLQLMPINHVCLSVCLLVWVSACLLVCLSACLLVCLSACLHVRLFACLLVCLSACLLVSLSACLLIYMSVCLLVCLSACLLVCLSACL